MTYSKVEHDSMNFHAFNDNATGSGPPQVISTQHSEAFGTLKFSNTFNGDYNPRWKDLVRAQLNATTPANGVKYLVHSNPYISAIINATNVNNGYITRFWSLLGSPLASLPQASDLTNGADANTQNHANARAISSFVNKAKSEISSFESGQDIAEIHQTLESIIHPMNSLRQHVLSYFSSLKKVKNKYKKAVSLKKALADTYLEWTFGWSPLAFDIADGIVGLSRKRFSSVPIEGSGKETYAGSWLSGATSVVDGAYGWKRQIRSQYQYKYKGVVNPYYSKQPRVLQELQLLPEDFLPTAWDLLPYSFVSDYFTNIGDIIRSYSFPSASIRWVNQTRRDTTRTIVHYARDLDNLANVLSPLSNWRWSNDVSGSNFDVEYVTFIRSAVGPGTLIAPLVLNIPPLSSKPWENIAALLTGNARRLSPFY